MPPTLDELKQVGATAIDWETLAVRQRLAQIGADRPLDVRDIRRLGIDTDSVEYECLGPPERTVAEDTPLTLTAEGEQYRGHLLNCDPVSGLIRFALNDNAGAQIQKGQLEFDPTFLLEALKDALIGLAPNDPHCLLAVRALFAQSNSIPAIHSACQDQALDQAQRSAIDRAMAGDVTHVWGPPGTGKTRTLAALIERLCQQSQKTIVAAPTNVAVDNLARALLKRGGALLRDLLAEGKFVRVGETTPELRKQQVHLDHAFQQTAAEGYPSLLATIEDLWRKGHQILRVRVSSTDLSGHENARRRYYVLRRLLTRIAPSDQAAAQLLDETTALAEEVKSVERAAVARAMVVFCTLTKLSLPGILKDVRAPNVIVDEASMVPMPGFLVGAARAATRVVTAGDFRQLPPVYVSDRPEVRQWYGRNVYQMASIDDPAVILDVRPMLSFQYRMHPAISRMISSLFYAGRLQDAPNVRKRFASEVSRSRLFLADTSGLQPTNQPTPSGSRINEKHAEFVTRLVADIRSVGCTDIGIIAPYKAQGRLLRDKLKAAHSGSLPAGLEVSTVHRFQGKEKTLIIFDVTDAPPLPVHFLNESQTPSVRQLVNVALSRAIDAVIVVGHASHLSQYLPQTAALSRVLAWCGTYGDEFGAETWSLADLNGYSCTAAKT